MNKQSFLHLFSLVSGLLSLFIIFVIYYEIIYGIAGLWEWSYRKYHSADFVITSLSYFSLFISLFPIVLFFLLHKRSKDWYKNKYFIFIVIAATLNIISSLFLYAMAAAGSPNFG